MKVFISWSGPKSQAVAQALRDWIPDVINEVEPFISTEIESGQRWSAVIASELDATNFGIICTTRANQHAPWLNFEAGALAKQIGDAKVAPLAIDLAPSEIELPLGQFNADPMTIDGIRKLMHSMNRAASNPLEASRLDRSIDQWWSVLNEKLDALPDDGVATSEAEVRPDRDILLEVLDSVRSLVRGLSYRPDDGGMDFDSYTDHLKETSSTLLNGVEFSPGFSEELLRYMARSQRGPRQKTIRLTEAEQASIARRNAIAHRQSMSDDEAQARAEAEAEMSEAERERAEQEAIDEAARENGDH